MTKMTTLILGAALLVLSACSSLPTADSDWDENYNFDGVKTYSFIDRAKLRSMTPLTSDITRNRIETAVEKTMAAKGISYEADSSKADVLVSYHVTSKDKQDIRTYNTGVNHCWNCRWGPGMGMGVGYSNTEVRVKDYVEGTLIIDIIEPASSESIWRGVMSARISDLKSQQERIEAINYAVTTVLETFPPKPAQ